MFKVELSDRSVKDFTGKTMEWRKMEKLVLIYHRMAKEGIYNLWTMEIKGFICIHQVGLIIRHII